MPFSTVYLESAPALGAGGAIANITTFVGDLFKIRGLMVGVRTVSGAAPVDELLTVAFTFASAKGTATTSLNTGTLDPSRQVANFNVDVAWSTQPTFSTSVGQQAYAVPLTTHHPAYIKWSEAAAIVGYQGSPSGGVVLWNVGTALPTNHIYAVSIQVES